MSLIEGESNEPKLPPLYNSLIFTGDPQIKTESLKIALLKELPHVHIFKTYVGRDLAPVLLQKFLETPDHIPSLFSAFINEKTPDFIFLEVTNIVILAKLFPNAIFETVQSPSFISNFCNIGRFTPQSFCGHLFARVNKPPYSNEPAEILDINYSQKIVIVKLIPIVKVANNDNPDEFELRLFDPEQYLSAKNPPTPIKVRINYKGDDSSFVNGFSYNDCKYVNGFLIDEIPISQMITWSNQLEEDEIHVFISPYEKHSYNEQQKKREMEMTIESQNTRKKEKELSKQFNFKIPKFDADETPASIARKISKSKSRTKLNEAREQNEAHSHAIQSSNMPKTGETHSSQNQDSSQPIIQIQFPYHSLINKLQEQFMNILNAFPLPNISLPSDNKLLLLDVVTLQSLLNEHKEKLRILKIRYESLYELFQQFPESNETVMSKARRTFIELRDQVDSQKNITAETIHAALLSINDIKSIIDDKKQEMPFDEMQKKFQHNKDKQNMYDKITKQQSNKDTTSKQDQLNKKADQNKQISSTFVVTDNPSYNFEVGDYVAIRQPMDNVKGTIFSKEEIEVEDEGKVQSKSFLTILTNPYNVLLTKDNMQLLNSNSLPSYCPFIFDEYDMVLHNQHGICIVTNCSYKSKKITLLSNDNRLHKVPYESIRPGKSDSSVRDSSNKKVLPGDRVFDTTNPRNIGTVLGTSLGKAYVLFDDRKLVCTRGATLSICYS